MLPSSADPLSDSWFPGPQTFEALQDFHAAGGTTVVYVGRPPGGATGGLWFHALLGEVPRCFACSYGVANVECTCSVVPIWHRTESLTVPSFHDVHDELKVYEREERAAPSDADSPAVGVLRRRRRRIFRS